MIVTIHLTGFDTQKIKTENLSSRFWQNIMIDIQTLILFLAKSLSDSAKSYTLYLDNLFSSISLAVALRKLDIEIMSTA